VREKPADYSLNIEHSRGGHEARRFVAVLGITGDDLDYLADALLAGLSICLCVPALAEDMDALRATKTTPPAQPQHSTP
jgi:hypothetical protein